MENAQYTESQTINDLYNQTLSGGRYVSWRVPTSLWLNITQRYFKPNDGWEVSLNGHYRSFSLVTTSIINSQTLQPRVVIATFEESVYTMNDEDSPTYNIIHNITDFMLEQRAKWIQEQGNDDPTAWKDTYIVLVLGTGCRFYVLESHTNTLNEYFADLGGTFYDAIDHSWIIHSVLTGLKERCEQ